MYSNMALKNVRRSFKDYTIYFLTLTFAVCIFYSFNSIQAQQAMFDMNKAQSQYVKIMGTLISNISVFISVILGALIIYATNFLINRRKKEFGIYMSLGMSKRKMSMILFFETLIIGLISLAFGLFVGIFLSQGLSILTAKLFVVSMSKYKFIVSTEAIIKTLCYFGVMYLLVMIFNVLIVSRYKLIDLLSASKKSEKVKIKNVYVSLFIFILSMIVLGVAYYLICKVGMDFEDRRFMESIILGIVGTALFFYGIASTLLFIIQRNKNIYLNKLNVFNTRQITSKFNTNFISMTIICLMLFLTICILSTGFSIKTGLENSLKTYTPFDASVQLSMKNKANIHIEEAMKRLNYKLGEKEDYCILNDYKLNVSTTKLLAPYCSKEVKMLVEADMYSETDAMSLSDFNAVRRLAGKEAVKLNDDEVLVASNYDYVSSAVQQFLNKESSITINNSAYKIKEKNPIKESVSTSGSSNTMFSLIVPDKLAKSSKLDAQVINFNFTDKSKKQQLEKIITDMKYNDLFKKTNFYISGSTREMIYESSRGLSTIVLFIAMYIGVVFLLASVAILALQQLSQCNESIDRYNSLRKIGASKSMIKKSILTQVLTFFMLPLLLAIVHSIVGIGVVSKYIKTIGDLNILGPSLITGLIMLVVYGGYFYATYIGYKNIITSDYN
ncbi:ABC transporter permease [Inconstantimicrobium mannanitabidum]|uniref:ABC transporter permease n=1 Tax=Inconstantimicrobium mannanitabidum TaxID=1604901 RepID=A0ACB5RDW4_9CLOT|nr:ABC transporter permease [Clostridium sp. TW13]GKX67295.1 ABC transporter permease [Clostridium sp. TW13]